MKVWSTQTTLVSADTPKNDCYHSLFTHRKHCRYLVRTIRAEMLNPLYWKVTATFYCFVLVHYTVDLRCRSASHGSLFSFPRLAVDLTGRWNPRTVRHVLTPLGLTDAHTFNNNQKPRRRQLQQAYYSRLVSLFSSSLDALAAVLLFGSEFRSMHTRLI